MQNNTSFCLTEPIANHFHRMSMSSQYCYVPKLFVANKGIQMAFTLGGAEVVSVIELNSRMKENRMG